MSGRILRFRSAPASGGDRAERGEAAAPSSLRAQTRGGPSGTAPLHPSQAARFRTLVVPHMASAYSLARYLCRDPAAAEDIAQDALLKAFRCFDGYRGGDAKAWLLAIVRTVYLDAARAGRPWAALLAPAVDAADEVADEGQATAEEALIRRDDVVALRAAIEAIPEPFREALVLRELEELSYNSIAEITGVPLGTVMSRLSRARLHLARRLAEEVRP